MRTKAEEAIRKLLDVLPEKAEITMSDREVLIGEIGHELMQGTMQSLSERQQVERNEVRGERCNTPMHKRGKRKKQVVTLQENGHQPELELEFPF